MILRRMATNNQIGMLKLILKDHSYIHDSYLPIIEAVNSNNPEILRFLFHYEKNINPCFLTMPMRVACRKKYTEIVKIILNYTPKLEEYFIDEAVIGGSLEIVSLLLDYNKNIPICELQFPLRYSAEYNCISIMKLLLEAFPDIFYLQKIMKNIVLK